MSRLLVLGNSEQAQRWSRLLEGRRTSRRKSATATGCEALVVVNDHSAAAVHSLRQALQLRRRQPGLSVAVLNLVEQEPDAGQGDAQTLARALATEDADGKPQVSTDQAAALMSTSLPKVQVRFSDDVLSFEYGAD